MQTNMLQSIQDYAKKINRSISFVDCVSLLLTAVILASFLLYIMDKRQQSSRPVRYIVGESENATASSIETRPFGSRKGKTYTYAWCGGSSVIKASNKIYFNTETEALRTGRTLSKLCSK